MTGLALRERKGFATPTETNVYGDALCFVVKTWTRHQDHRKSIERPHRHRHRHRHRLRTASLNPQSPFLFFVNATALAQLLSWRTRPNSDLMKGGGGGLHVSKQAFRGWSQGRPRNARRAIAGDPAAGGGGRAMGQFPHRYMQARYGGGCVLMGGPLRWGDPQDRRGGNVGLGPGQWHKSATGSRPPRPHSTTRNCVFRRTEGE